MYSIFGNYCKIGKIYDYPNIVRDIIFENKEKIAEYDENDVVVITYTWKTKKYKVKNKDYLKAYKQIYDFIKK